MVQLNVNSCCETFQEKADEKEQARFRSIFRKVPSGRMLTTKNCPDLDARSITSVQSLSNASPIPSPEQAKAKGENDSNHSGPFRRLFQRKTSTDSCEDDTNDNTKSSSRRLFQRKPSSESCADETPAKVISSRGLFRKQSSDSCDDGLPVKSGSIRRLFRRTVSTESGDDEPPVA
jgi:hypothetical protein